MEFTVLQVRVRPPKNSKNEAFLITDNWDDWYIYHTQYWLEYYDNEGKKNEIGAVKIGQIGQTTKRPDLNGTFNKLDANFFSLGQDDSYYVKLSELGENIMNKILKGLNDIVKKEEIYKLALNEDVTKVSLLRFVSTKSITGQFKRIINGDALLTPYHFTYECFKPRSNSTAYSLDFNVEPESNPPTNIHVLIGRNGVGKTYLIDNMITALINEKEPNKKGEFKEKDVFAGIVNISFSAFDESEPYKEQKDKTVGLKYTYVGLKRKFKESQKGKNLLLKSLSTLNNEFTKSLSSIISRSKQNRWKEAIQMLKADRIFKDSNIESILYENDIKSFKAKSKAIFRKLSSGHKVIFLTITRLVELLEERTLVLIDEPEMHLHPPLLSAFIRTFSNLLIKKNAVAIIATHSPVILQEVPKSCVWKLKRSGAESKVERLEGETFGENVGILTREVFGLEVTDSGFHKILFDTVESKKDFNAIIDEFGGQLGMEARGIVRTLISNRESD